MDGDRGFNVNRRFDAQREFGKDREFSAQRELGGDRESDAQRELGKDREFSANLKSGADRTGGDIEPVVGLEAVRYDKDTGLVPVVVQHWSTGQVLMLAYTNREALKRTFGTGQAWFWSRARQNYWCKGETSGHVMEVRSVRVDCDGDTVLYLVNPAGPACHTGAVSCFFRRVTYGFKSPGESVLPRRLAGDDTGIRPDEIDLSIVAAGGVSDTSQTNDPTCATDDATAWEGYSGVESPPTSEGGLEPPDAATSGSADMDQRGDIFAAALENLWETVNQRFHQRPQKSYTTYLFAQGTDKIAKKVGEEAVEIAIAAKNAESRGKEGRDEVAQESADLLYHLLVLWKQAGIRPNDVAKVLADRVR